MTYRSLLVGTAVVVGVSIIAVVAMTLHEDGKPGVSADKPAPAAGPRQEASSPVAPPVETAPDAVPADVASDTVTPEVTGEASPAAEASETDPVALATENPGAFVETLSDKQNSELYRLLQQKEYDRQRKEARYNLLTDTRLQFLGMTNRKLAISDVQKQQVAAIKANYKPQIEELLADVWARQDDANRRLQEAQKSLKSMQDQMSFYEKNKDLYQEQWDLMQQAGEIAKPLDDQYLAEVRTVLTPEQLKELDDMHVLNMNGGVSITRGDSSGSTNVIMGVGGGGPVSIQGAGGGKASGN